MDNRLQRQRGRPAGHQPAARAQILDAVLRLLEAAPLSKPSLREVAQEAGVTAALLHYHFVDLPGLMRTLVSERALPLMQPLLQEPAGTGTASTLGRFLQRWTALTQRHPWLYAAVLLAPQDVAGVSQVGGMLRALVSRAQQEGVVRADLPDHYVALLILSMGTLPHLARTALGAGLAAGLEGDSPSLALRHFSVLQAGLAPPAAAR